MGTILSLLEVLAGVILLLVSIWSYLRLKLRSFKRPFEIVIVSSVILIHAGIFSFTDEVILSKLWNSIAIFLLAIGFAMLILASKTIGIGK